MTVKSPLIVIVGPTASGKTALAIELAREFNGEIICADSRTIYKGMDIGTAKPTAEEQALVKHWGVDLVEPDQPFSVVDFKTYAEEKISDIRRRGKVPFLVGGSGLYVDAVIFDYSFTSEPNPELRKELEYLTVEQLIEYCNSNNVELPDNKYNKRYLIRAIEQKGINRSRNNQPIDDCIIVGITTDKTKLKERIAKRAEHLFDNNVVQEAIKLGKIYGQNLESMTGNIYKLLPRYVSGELTSQELKEKFIISDWRLAKKQLTWFKRNDFINWFDSSEAYKFIKSKLQ